MCSFFARSIFYCSLVVHLPRTNKIEIAKEKQEKAKKNDKFKVNLNPF